MARQNELQKAVLIYNNYHRKHYPQMNVEPFESVCTMAVVANPNVLPYLKNDESKSRNLSIVEDSIMRACNICMASSDNDERTIETWPAEKVAIFLADAKREKCYLERVTLVKGVFSLMMEMELEGKKDEDRLEKCVLSKVETQTERSYTDYINNEIYMHPDDIQNTQMLESKILQGHCCLIHVNHTSNRLMINYNPRIIPFRGDLRCTILNHGIRLFLSFRGARCLVIPT